MFSKASTSNKQTYRIAGAIKTIKTPEDGP
jgi:hypothetical protein